MKIKSYTEENGYVNIILANGEEQLCFINPNIYNEGKWKLNSYIKRVLDKPNESFDIVIARYGNKDNCSYILSYSSGAYSRMINCDCNDIVQGEVIRNNDSSNRISYYPNVDDLGIDLNTYIKQTRDYHDENNNVFSGNVENSSKAILSCIEYSKKYNDIFKEIESKLKTNIEENIKMTR